MDSDPSNLKQEFEVSFGVKKNTCHPCAKQTQFLLTLAWACIVYKIQGISLSEGVISLDLHKQRSFYLDQMYVALSRVTKLEKLYLLGQYCSSEIKLNENPRREYERLRTQSKLIGVSKYLVSENSLMLTLLNVKSLKNHVIDLIKDQELLVNDLLCLTETQIELEDNTPNIEGGLRQFYNVSFNSNLSKYRRLALCATRDITLTNHQFDGFFLVTFIKQSFVDHSITMILLYRSPNSSEIVFLDMINQFGTVHLIWETLILMILML